MPPIQQLGPAASNEFTTALYYAPPPQQPVNMFAAFWSGFLRERTPWARELFSARLRAMDPAAKAAALLELEKQETARQRAYLDMLKASKQSDSSLMQTILRGGFDLAMKQADVETKVYQEQSETRRAQTSLTSDQQKKVLEQTEAAVTSLQMEMHKPNPDEHQIQAAAARINKALRSTKATLGDEQFSTVSRALKGELRLRLGAENFREILPDIEVPEVDAPLQGLDRPGVSSSEDVVSRALETGQRLGVSLGGSEGASVSRTVPSLAAPAPAGALPAPASVPAPPVFGGGAFAPPPAAPSSLGGTREELREVFESRGGLGEHADPLPGHTRETRRTRLKREAVEEASPEAATALAVGAPRAEARDALARFLAPGPPVAREIRGAAEDIAGTTEANKVEGGALAKTLRPTLEDEDIAADIDVSEKPLPPPPPRKHVRFDEASARNFERFLRQGEEEGATPRTQARFEAFNEEAEEPIEDRSIADVNRRARELMQAEQEDELARFLKKRKKNGGAADAR